MPKTETTLSWPESRIEELKEDAAMWNRKAIKARGTLGLDNAELYEAMEYHCHDRINNLRRGNRRGLLTWITQLWGAT